MIMIETLNQQHDTIQNLIADHRAQKASFVASLVAQGESTSSALVKWWKHDTRLHQQLDQTVAQLRAYVNQ